MGASIAQTLPQRKPTLTTVDALEHIEQQVAVVAHIAELYQGLDRGWRRALVSDLVRRQQEELTR